MRILLATFVVALSFGCGVDVDENETIGRDGVIKFGAETKLAFSQRIAAGSSFEVSFDAADSEELNVAGATLRSSDEDVATIAAGSNARSGRVTLVKPGTFDLEVVQDGTVLDRIALRSGKVGATSLVDGDLFLATDNVDARLPASFAIRTDTAHQLFVTAVDVCGGDLLDLGASTLETVDGVPVSIERLGFSQFSIETQVPGDVNLVLQTPGIDDLAYDVSSVDAAQVDEVSANVVTADETGSVVLWGRAFADDVELVGPLDFSWTADPRVTLVAFQGPVTSGTVFFPLQGEPADDRPAVVTAEVFGEPGSVDLLAQLNFVNTRGPPARELVVEEETPSCGGDSTQSVCNPEAALVLFLGARSLRRLRRLRRL
jgi:hypothetical protein